MVATYGLSENARSAAATLGYTSLKPEQKSAILSFLVGNDVLISLPTGYGRSICYAALPYAFDQLRGTCKSSKLLLCPN